jgi:hypothetical protein
MNERCPANCGGCSCHLGAPCIEHTCDCGADDCPICGEESD